MELTALNPGVLNAEAALETRQGQRLQTLAEGLEGTPETRRGSGKGRPPVRERVPEPAAQGDAVDRAGERILQFRRTDEVLPADVRRGNGQGPVRRGFGDGHRPPHRPAVRTEPRSGGTILRPGPACFSGRGPPAVPGDRKLRPAGRFRQRRRPDVAGCGAWPSARTMPPPIPSGVSRPRSWPHRAIPAWIRAWCWP